MEPAPAQDSPYGNPDSPSRTAGQTPPGVDCSTRMPGVVASAKHAPPAGEAQGGTRRKPERPGESAPAESAAASSVSGICSRSACSTAGWPGLADFWQWARVGTRAEPLHREFHPYLSRRQAPQCCVAGCELVEDGWLPTERDLTAPDFSGQAGRSPTSCQPVPTGQASENGSRHPATRGRPLREWECA